MIGATGAHPAQAGNGRDDEGQTGNGRDDEGQGLH
jgi:hypothetical protein